MDADLVRCEMCGDRSADTVTHRDGGCSLTVCGGCTAYAMERAGVPVETGARGDDAREEVTMGGKIGPEANAGLQMKYFILKPKGETLHAAASRAAMRAYADTIRMVDPDMAADLRAWARREHDRATHGGGA